MGVLAASILCDRKASSQLVAVPAVLQMRGVAHYYVNVEQNPFALGQFRPLEEYLAGHSRVTIEYWYRSGWEGSRPAYDQDQNRLFGIVTARNMAIDFATSKLFEWLLYVDADVVPRPDGVERLLALGKPLCGGYVPGRGIHSHAHYVFHQESEHDGVVKCVYGTCGYMLVHRDIFTRLRFRFGPHATRGTWLSEDPAYCSDAIHLGLADAFYVDKRAVADHWDDPERPLTQEGICGSPAW